MAQKTVLGKGLASLIPTSLKPSTQAVQISSEELGDQLNVIQPQPAPAQPPVESASRDRHLGIAMANIDDIHANQFQPRREFDDAALNELMLSIQSSGIIQPLVVRKGSKDGFELIAGERRLRAAKLAGLKQVPIVIRKTTDRESLELALIENIQRQELNCIDEALAYFQLIQDFSLTQEEIAERVGKDRATIANHLRLLRLPEEIIDDLKKQVLSFGHGKALLGLEDAEMRMRVRKQILEKKLSVRETEALVDHLKRAKDLPENQAQTSEEADRLVSRLAHLSQELGRHWSTKVEVKGTENRGKIVIHYSSRQDLDRILEGMQPPIHGGS